MTYMLMPVMWILLFSLTLKRHSNNLDLFFHKGGGLEI